ncbi:MAG: CIA30 family protein [Opitutales bacterium]|nr:CIA30 family protein [Opitutales bacterium]
MNFLSSNFSLGYLLISFFCLAVTPYSSAINKKKKQKEMENLMYDFTEDNPATNWITVNDNVMGGRSEGGFSFNKKRLIFSGTTNTNGGGFSSIRTNPSDFNLSDKEGLHIRYKGDGRTFKLGVRMDGKSVSYRSNFNTGSESKGWQEIRIPFDKMEVSWRGRPLSKVEHPLIKSKIRSIEFMIYDKKDGPFKLQVDWVKSY